MKPVESFIHNGYTVEIHSDMDPSSPREFENAAVLVCFHKRYCLGDEGHGYEFSDFSSWAELRDRIILDHKPVVILPLGLIDHSGISMYIGSGAHDCDPGGWDSGQVGWAFVSREKALSEWGKKVVTKRVREMAEKCLRAEVEEYDKFLRGEVYGFVIKDGDGEQIDSCWGHIGWEWALEAAKDAVPDTPAPVGGEGQDEAFEETLP